MNSSESELYRANSTQRGDSNTAYDALGRQTAFARGTLSSSGHNGTQLDTIASSSRQPVVVAGRAGQLVAGDDQRLGHGADLQRAGPDVLGLG